MSDQDRIDAATAEYTQLAHAMQSGVATEMANGGRDTEPKHLRVGVNSSLVNSSALGELLIRKGLITEVEYAEAMRDGMKAEVERYEQRLSERYGRTITLG